MFVGGYVRVGTHIEPLFSGPLPHLQTIDLILHEQCHRSEVSVASDSAREFLIRIGGLRWVVKVAERSDRTICESIEVVGSKVQGLCNHRQDVSRELMHLVVVAHGGSTEFLSMWKVLWPLVWPGVQLFAHEVGVVLGDLLANVEAFLLIGICAGFQDLASKILISTVPCRVV